MPLQTLAHRARIGLFYDKAHSVHPGKCMTLFEIVCVNILMMTGLKGLHIVLYMYIFALPINSTPVIRSTVTIWI